MKRKEIKGIGTQEQVIDVKGWNFAIVSEKTAVNMTCVRGNMTYVWGNPQDGKGRFNIPSDVTEIKISGWFDTPWKIVLYDVAPAINQTELSVHMTEDGQFVFSGDDDITYFAQDVDSGTVDIKGLKIDLDCLTQLFNEANVLKTKKSAAKYLKLKQAFIQQSKEVRSR